MHLNRAGSENEITSNYIVNILIGRISSLEKGLT